MLFLSCHDYSSTPKIKSRITEFPDGSRIFHSHVNETPRDIAAALGLEVEVLVGLNRSNYHNIHEDTILQRGMLLEIPNSNFKISKAQINTAEEENSSILESQLTSGSGMAVHVFGSGENVGKRTDGQLLAKDRNRPYVVQFHGRELKLSEFCQLAGNKKNRPRESIIISSTNECLFEYEARVLARRTSGHISEPLGGTYSLNATYEIQKARYKQFPKSREKNFDLPGKGYLVTIFSGSEFHEKIGVVRNRCIDGWYEVGILDMDPCKLGLGLRSLSCKKTIRLRGHNILTSPLDQQLHDVQIWATQMNSMLVSMTNVACNSENIPLEGAIDRLSSSVELIRVDSVKKGFKMIYNGGWLQVLCCTSNPGGWTAICESLMRIKEDSVSFTTAILACIQMQQCVNILSKPLLALEFLGAEKHVSSSSDTILTSSVIGNDATEKDSAAIENSSVIKIDMISSADDARDELTKLSEIDQKIVTETRRKRALVRRQDAAIGDSAVFLIDFANFVKEHCLQI